MARVRSRRSHARYGELTHQQAVELLVGPRTSEGWQHFATEADARAAWFEHRDELLDGAALPEGFPAGLQLFEVPAGWFAEAAALADRLGIGRRAMENAARAVWLVGAGLLDPAYIDRALDATSPTWADEQLGAGTYLADALRALLKHRSTRP